MEWMGWFCFIIILFYSSYPGKVKKLEAKVKRLERIGRGDLEMAKIISDLVGKECKIKTEDVVVAVGTTEFQCTVLEVDDEWLKFSYYDKKKACKTVIIRIDAIESMELLGE